MKKFLICVSLLGATQTVHAVKPEQPWLLTPLSSPALSTTSPVLFSWSNTKGATINNYRLVVSTTSDFSGYNQKTKRCQSKVSCFTTTTKKTTYSLPLSATILKPDTHYYWRVEAVNNAGESSLFDIRAFAFGTPTTVLDPKFSTVGMPTVLKATTDISSVEQGKKITFTATLDAILPTGYNVKVNYANGLIPMTGSGTSFTLAATPSKSASYSIGIYDSKNVLKSNKLTGNFEVTAAISANVPSILSLKSKVASISKVETNKVYTVELSATDSNGNLRQINMDWGDGSSDSVNVAESETLSLTHIYTTASPFTWNATAYDYSDASSNIISQVVTVSAPVVPVVAPPVVTTPIVTTPPVVSTPVVVKPPRFAAVDRQGNTITGGNDWACSRDETTKLIWEVKTNDGRLHDKDWTYSWYEPDASKNDGYAGVENGGTCNGSSKCNTYAFINAVNAEKFCGGDNWRLPTKSELEGLVLCSDDKSTTLGENEQGDICIGTPTSPTIDTDYFPDTRGDWFWSSSTLVPPVVISDKTAVTTTGTITTPAVKATTVKATTTKTTVVNTPIKVDATSAWNVLFYDGSSHADHKGNRARVRLVREDAAVKK